MKKNMFNDKYGLTHAVLEGRKTQTRRKIPLSAEDEEYLDTAFDWRIKITNVRVERLQEISDEDCLNEGIGKRGDTPLEFFVYGEDDVLFDTPQRAFASLIDKTCGKGTWENNPWVFVYDFELIK